MSVSTDEFSNLYWSQYVLIEREFATTLAYVSLSKENGSTFSYAYQKLLLELGSEVDIALKLYCEIIDPSFRGENIERYKTCIKEKYTCFITQGVQLVNFEQKIFPWNNWNEGEENTSDAPFWWKAYNKIKHCRTSVGEIDGIQQEYYKFANQKYTLYALAGLFQVLVSSYRLLATREEKRIKVPLPGSKFFKMVGEEWDEIAFYGDFALSLQENGELIFETCNVLY